ncbi:MAG: glycoside hydrolase family 38 N-terminal domain-containing protein [Planctomycetota bacterium]|jgi:mannosylglycerate hydrolase
MEKKQKAIGYIVTHTHWDREWRYPLWQNRLHLIRFMDTLLDLLDHDPEYRCMVLDSQSVMVEDYLQVKAENKQRTKKYIAEGRIKIGPWYTLPDLYPVDGECLVRNLLKGDRYSNELGKVMKIAFTTFGWGQIAQFPQIFAGFGIDFIICGKNVSKQRAPQMEFIWEAPDGTGVLTSRLGDFARANFFMNAYLPIRFGKKYMSTEYQYEWGNSGTVIRKANAKDSSEDYFKTSEGQAFYPEQIKSAIQTTWDATNETTVKNVRLLADGSDSTTPQPILTRIIKEANLLFENIEFIHGTLEEYAGELKKHIKLEELKVVKGELRDGPSYACSANALATRIPIKQLNRRVENSLIKRAEPLASIAAMRNSDYPERFAALAWKYLLLSHPHDSINGVGQDKTADDTVYRLNQALEISNVIFDKKASELAMDIDLSKYNADDILLIAINPYPRPVSKIEKVCIDTPGHLNAWEISIADCDGQDVCVQHMSRQEKIVPVDDLEARPWPFHADRHMAYIDTGIIPAGGYAVYKVSVKKKMDRTVCIWPEVRKSAGDEISKVPNILENEFLCAEIMPNGTINLYDKVNNKHYHSLNYFEDTGDTGDYWVYYPPVKNKTLISLGANARIWQIENGGLSATIGVEIKMEVPKSANWSESEKPGQGSRSNDLTTITITSLITLHRGAKQLEIETEIQNTAEDHRMRMMFPTGIAANQSDAAGHFNIDSRPIEPARLFDGQFYPDMQTHPQQNFVDTSDGEYGFAVINRGLTEYEVLRDNQKTLAITLFRSVRNNICTEFRSYSRYPNQKGGQLLQRLKFEYAIIPHKCNWQEGLVFEMAQQFNTGVCLYQISAHKNGSMPQKMSLYSVEPENLMLSCFKPAEDRESFVMRLFNPTSKTIEGEITVAAEIKKAHLCTLNEERINVIEILNNNQLNVTVPAGKILTIELEQ